MKTLFSISPSVEFLEKASDAVKYGKISDKPFVEFVISSLLESDFAPKNEHVLSATVQYAPYHLKNNKWSEKLKEQLKINVIHVLDKAIPDIKSLIKHT